jgi:hypothetical protein
VWLREAKKFNLTLGLGLAGFKETLGADAVLLVVGKDTTRSGSRIVLDMLKAMPPRAQSQFRLLKLSHSEAFPSLNTAKEGQQGGPAWPDLLPEEL